MTKLFIFIHDNEIIVQNKVGKEKKFPRCGITNVEFFVLEMAKKGNLNDLFTE